MTKRIVSFVNPTLPQKGKIKEERKHPLPGLEAATLAGVL